MEALEDTAIYKYAIRLLAPRDYSRHKLKEKILSREFSRDQIDEVLDVLEEKKYLNEERYAKGKIRGYISRRKGPRYIEQKLKVERISNISQYIEEVALEYEVDWVSIASEIVEKEMRNKELTYQLKSKIYGKLLSRGFSSDIINHALNQ